MEVSAEADLLDLNFVGAKDLGRATYAVVFGVVEVIDIVRIKTNFRSEEFRIPNYVLVAGVPLSHVQSA